MSTTATDAELRAKVVAEIERCYRVADAHYGRKFPRALVTFGLCRRAAGCAWIQRAHIEINPAILRADPAHAIGITAPHEAAHMIHYMLRPGDYARGKRQQHGPFWQSLMRLFGVADPERRYVPEAAVAERVEAARPSRSRRHQYRCTGCGQTLIAGPRQHAAIQRGGSFRHIACRTPISPSALIA